MEVQKQAQQIQCQIAMDCAHSHINVSEVSHISIQQTEVLSHLGTFEPLQA